MLKYQKMNTEQTLREGIAELRAFVGPEHDSAIKMGSELDNTMKAHDAVHVIFGCDTSMRDEAISHFVMLLNTDVKFSDIKKVAQSKEHKSIVGEHKKIDILKVVIGSPSDLIKSIQLRRQMAKKWPWFGYAKYLDQPIKKIRQEYNITSVNG